MSCLPRKKSRCIIALYRLCVVNLGCLLLLVFELSLFKLGKLCYLPKLSKMGKLWKAIFSKVFMVNIWNLVYSLTWWLCLLCTIFIDIEHFWRKLWSYLLKVGSGSPNRFLTSKTKTVDFVLFSPARFSHKVYWIVFKLTWK